MARRLLTGIAILELISVFDDQGPPTLEPIKRNVALEESVLASPLGQRLTWFTGPFLRYDTLLIDGQETLIATDIRLGFPGFHPFSFLPWQRGKMMPGLAPCRYKRADETSRAQTGNTFKARCQGYR